MPRYRNDTERAILFGGVNFQPGEAKSVNMFLPFAELGLTKVSDQPAVPSPVLLFEEVVLEAGVPQGLDIPWGADTIVISATPKPGESATMKIGDGAAEIPLNDDCGGYVSPPGGHKWTKAAKVTLESEAGATVYVLAEGVA